MRNICLPGNHDRWYRKKENQFSFRVVAAPSSKEVRAEFIARRLRRLERGMPTEFEDASLLSWTVCFPRRTLFVTFQHRKRGVIDKVPILAHFQTKKYWVETKDNQNEAITAAFIALYAISYAIYKFFGNIQFERFTANRKIWRYRSNGQRKFYLGEATERLPLSLSRHMSLSVITLDKFSRGHLVSTDKYVFVGQPTLVCPYVGVHRIMSLTSSLLHQQYPACFARPSRMICKMGGCPFRCSFVGCCFQDLINKACCILVSFSFSFFPNVCVQVVQPYRTACSATAWILQKYSWCNGLGDTISNPGRVCLHFT